MVYVELEYKYTPTGRRKPLTRVSQHDISDGLSDALKEMAETNGFCSVGKWDWNKGVLYITRGDGVDETIKKYSNAPADYKLFEETRKTMNYQLKEMKFKYEYIKEVIDVDLKNMTCTVEKKPSRKEFESCKGIPKWKPYKVALSDRCVFEKIKPKDVVLIRKFFNDVHMAVQVIESYKEPTKEEIEEQEQSLRDLMGDY